MGRAFTAAAGGPPRCFVLDGETYELRSDGWRALVGRLAGDWYLPVLLDLLVEQDADALLDRLDDPSDPLAVSDLAPVAVRLVDAATGRPWWQAGILLGSAAGDQWDEIDGELTGRGVNLINLIDTAPGRACSVVYAWLVRGADSKARTKLDATISRPPPGLDVAVSPLWTAEEEGAAFQAAAAASGGRVGRRATPGDRSPAR